MRYTKRVVEIGANSSRVNIIKGAIRNVVREGLSNLYYQGNRPIFL
jgi:hypothetical protein